MAKRPKFTPTQIKQHIKKIQETIDKQKRENEGEHFTSVTPEEIEKKLKRVNSPMIVSQGWNSTRRTSNSSAGGGARPSRDVIDSP